MEQLTVEGDAFERGLQQGRHFGPAVLEAARQAISALPQMPGLLPRWARPAFAGGLVGALGRMYLGRHRQTLSGHQGGKFRRGLDGLAEGFAAPVARLYGFASFEIEAARLDFTLGCTSLAFAAE